MQIVPLRFCHVGTKRSVLAFKIRQNPFSEPGPRWGNSRRSPDPLSAGRGYPTPLGTDPPSALAMRPPEVQPYAYDPSSGGATPVARSKNYFVLAADTMADRTFLQTDY